MIYDMHDIYETLFLRNIYQKSYLPELIYQKKCKYT